MKTALSVGKNRQVGITISIFISTLVALTVPVSVHAFTLTPSTDTVFDTTISDTSYSIYICDPNHTCSSIHPTTGASDQCAYIGATALASAGGRIGQGYYEDENGQPAGPCDESIVGTWKVRQYQYSGGTFSWIGSAVNFTVTAPPFTLTPNTGSTFDTTISTTSSSVYICDPNHTCATIHPTTGASDQCAYISSTDLASSSGRIAQGYYTDENNQPQGPCIESRIGTWKVRQYQYSGGTFSWVSPAVSFTISSSSLQATPDNDTFFDTTINDNAYSVYICDPNHTCSSINASSGASDQCAYISYTDLASSSGRVAQGFYTDENGQPAGPCNESLVGTWKIRQYQYTAGAFSWVAPATTFTVSSSSIALSPTASSTFDTIIASTSASIYICDPNHSCRTIHSSTGASDQCAYVSSGDLVSHSGRIAQGFYSDENGQPAGPCNENLPGTWKIRPYQYSAGLFSWLGLATVFTVQ